MKGVIVDTLLIITLILIYLKLNLVEGNCEAYGICYDDFVFKKSCYTPNAPPIPINSASATDILKRRCPHLFTETDNPSLCCDAEQVENMDESLQPMDQLFARCPTCIKNVVRHICELSCSPNQNEFYKATATEINEEEKEYITAMDVRISKTYMYEAYDSCKQVSYPSTGKLVLDVACGKWASTYCTPERWFEYMGTGDYSPMALTYITVENSSSAINVPTLPCSESYNIDSAACSCIDCALSCVTEPYPAPDEPFEIIGFNGFAFACALLVLLFGTASIVVMLCNYSRLSQLDKTGLDDRFESRSVISSIFKKIGTDNPPVTPNVWCAIITFRMLSVPSFLTYATLALTWQKN